METPHSAYAAVNAFKKFAGFAEFDWVMIPFVGARAEAAWWFGLKPNYYAE
jgi:hypothetical protein